MTKRRVPLFKTSPVKSVLIDPAATEGAVVGVNLRWEDGTLVQRDELTGGNGAQPSSDGGTTDGVEEGRYNLYFTDERAQDAVGAILLDSDNITLFYDDDGPGIKANLTDVTVTAGGALKKYGFDAEGRLAETDDATTDDLPEGATNLYFTAERVRDNLITDTGDLLTLSDGSLLVA